MMLMTPMPSHRRSSPSVIERFARRVTQMMATQPPMSTAIERTSPAEVEPPDAGFIRLLVVAITEGTCRSLARRFADDRPLTEATQTDSRLVDVQVGGGDGAVG